MVNSKPCPENPILRVLPEIEEKVLYLRRNYHYQAAQRPRGWK